MKKGKTFKFGDYEKNTNGFEAEAPKEFVVGGGGGGIFTLSVTFLRSISTGGVTLELFDARSEAPTHRMLLPPLAIVVVVVVC